MRIARVGNEMMVEMDEASMSRGWDDGGDG